ncbi:MAG: ABC transporter permease subunit [Betaproteobacteria bacterium]|nr:ABC transporter permease subunit [Betaproteobacteria bacterium]
MAILENPNLSQHADLESVSAAARLSVAKRQRLQDVFFHALTLGFSLLVLVALMGILISLVINAWPALQKFGIGFIWRVEWDIINQEFGAAIAIFGTVVSASIALVIAVPLSFGIAVFLTETCPVSLRRPLGTAIELLAAVPSIIYGMFGLFLAAGIVLAFMILPFIAAVMRDVFEIVPPVLRESAYGIGCTTWEVVRNIVLPYTQKGVIGGVMLGLGRALGETMAVTFVIGNSQRLGASLFSPGTSIASTLANEFGEADDFHLSTLFALGFLLFVITFVVLSLAKWMMLRTEKSKGAKT